LDSALLDPRLKHVAAGTRERFAVQRQFIGI
jgi:hypothetical protein